MALPPLPEPFGNYALGGFSHIMPPPDISWWPTTPGWQVLAFLLAVLLLRAAHRRYRRWQRNRYRADALLQLDRARRESPCQALPAIARLLKAAALVRFPRDQVAPLSGRDWVEWLQLQAPGTFTGETGNMLTEQLYRGAADITPAQVDALAADAAAWLRNHREPDGD